MQSHWTCKPTVLITVVGYFVIKFWQLQLLNVHILRRMHNNVTGNMIFDIVCLLILGFHRMSSNAGSTAGGMCRSHQGAEEWRGASGLQNKRWHYCPTQGCAQQEPYSTYSECNTHTIVAECWLSFSFATPIACLQTFPLERESLQVGNLWQRVLEQLSTEGAWAITKYVRINMPSLNGLAYSLHGLVCVWFEEACNLNERIYLSHIIDLLLSQNCWKWNWLFPLSHFHYPNIQCHWAM